MGTKRVAKTRNVQKTRLVPGSNGGYATEVYIEPETYYVDEYVPDTASTTTVDTYSPSGE
jgi:hypothetical protein